MVHIYTYIPVYVSGVVQKSADTKDLNVQRLVDIEVLTTNMIVEILVYPRS